MTVQCDLSTSTQIASGVRVRKLSHTFPNGTHALANLNLDIPRGLFGLLGPNGAGKTTLMRVLATLQVPTSGSVSFDGLDVLATRSACADSWGTCRRSSASTRGSAPSACSTTSRCSRASAPPHCAASRLRTFCSSTNLYDVRTKAVSGYSGGMRQRFGIAQACSATQGSSSSMSRRRASIPRSGTASSTSSSEIGEEDTVVILSTHILDEVEKICPRIGVLLKGRLAGVGTYDELLQQLAGRVWRKAVARSEVPELRKSLQVLTERHSRGQVVVHVQSPTRPGDGFEPVSGDLHDVYFAMTAEVTSAS